MEQLRLAAVNNYLDQTPTPLEKLILPTVLKSIPSASRITSIHHPISVIDAVHQDQLEPLASRLETMLVLKDESHNRQWWRWCYVYTQLRISTFHAVHSQIKIGTRDLSAVDVVADDVEAVLESQDMSQLETLEKEVALRDTKYWNHLLYLIQSKAAFLNLNELFEEFKPQAPEPQAQDPLHLEQLTSNELLFDVGRADPAYAARAIIGEAPNYIDKNAVVHEEAWLNTSVKGYKFTIYYRSIATGERPKYRIEPLKDGTSNIIFSASNYPSLSFNILSKPWDHTRWAPIKVVDSFQRGTLELQFGFK